MPWPSALGVPASRSIAHRNAASVLPDPVGALIRTCSPEAIAGHACSWAAVGASNALSNQSRTAGEKTPSDYEQPKAESGESEALGGTAAAPLAQSVLGCSPMSRCSTPPGRIAA